MTDVTFTDGVPILLCMSGALLIVAAIHQGMKLYRQHRFSHDGSPEPARGPQIVVICVLILTAAALFTLGIPGLVRFLHSGPPLVS